MATRTESGPAPATKGSGRVEGIFITEAAGEPMTALETAQVVAGRGIEGDRYVLGTGFYSDGREGRQLTLIEVESLEALEQDGIQLAPVECRRNVVTRGVRLNPLVGKRFRVGEVECLGVVLNEPCTHLERLTKPGVLRSLVHRGGLRADVLRGGTIAVGDTVVELPG